MEAIKKFSVITGATFLAAGIYKLLIWTIYGVIFFAGFLHVIDLVFIAATGLAILIWGINKPTIAMFGGQSIIRLIILISQGINVTRILLLIIPLLMMACCILVVLQKVKAAKIIVFVPLVLFIIETVLSVGNVFKILVLYDVLMIVAYLLFAIYVNFPQIKKDATEEETVQTN